MMEKIITTLVAALLPFIATYFSKLNKNNIRKNAMEDAQKRIDFINSYFDVSNKLLSETDLITLKNTLSNELNEIMTRVRILDKKEQYIGYQKLTTTQKVFITFKPLSTFGWIWGILFYIFFVLDLFLTLALFVDENENFSFNAPLYHFNNPELVVSLIIVMVIPIIFRWLAIKNYRKYSDRAIEEI